VKLLTNKTSTDIGRLQFTRAPFCDAQRTKLTGAERTARKRRRRGVRVEREVRAHGCEEDSHRLRRPLRLPQNARTRWPRRPERMGRRRCAAYPRTERYPKLRQRGKATQARGTTT